MNETVYAVDLFAGAGGTSTGLALACRELGKKADLTAINHWQTAINSHSANHPWAKHICANVESLDPREVVPGKHLNLLVASPECTHFSRAAGGRPKQDQKRSSAWQILRWLELLKVDSVLVENVIEFGQWGPLTSRGIPIKSRKGEIYASWLSAIRSFGYNVDAKVLNAADYGSPTSRSRLFIVAKKGKEGISWPEPTHSKNGTGKHKWRAAREIIDWSVKGKSIFTRKKPLSIRTIRRIIEGLKRFGGSELQPFIVLMEHGGGVRSISKPLPTITTAKGGSMALADPFVLSQASGGAPRSVKDPLPTIPTAGAHALIESAITDRGAAEPFLVEYHGGKKKNPHKRIASVDKPIATIDTSNRFGLAEAFLLPVRGYFGGNTPKSVDEPLGTITRRGYGALVESFLVELRGTDDVHVKGSARSLDKPLATVTTCNHSGLVESSIGEAHSINEPLPGIPTNAAVALVQPEVNGRYLDIRFRMLQPNELAGAMGFPRKYKLRGTKTEVIRQIGNAVAVDVAKALCVSLLSDLG